VTPPGRRASRPLWRDGFIETNGVRLHYVTQGSGPLMLFLHGFPDFWFSWRHQIPEFAIDHRVVALDMRGYNDSEKPPARSAYGIDQLVGDVAGVIETMGGGKATLVGHDWGGAVAWATANARPELLDRLIVMNMPHPALFIKALRRPKQLLRSWYILLFQLPVVPELMLTANNAEAVAQIFRRSLVDSAAITTAELDRYRRAMLKPGAARAQLNYYRNVVTGGLGRRYSVLEMPTLLLWAEEDRVLGQDLIEGTEMYVRNLTVRRVPDCGHFVQQEKPLLVNAEIRSWLAANAAGSRNRRRRRGSSK
jgi:pimeloyl-ACP methyl ester carboxylesterase